MVPKCGVEGLSKVPKYKQTMMCLRKKMLVLDKLFSGMSYSDDGHEFNVNGSTNVLDQLSLNKHSHKQGYVLTG